MKDSNQKFDRLSGRYVTLMTGSKKRPVRFVSPASNLRQILLPAMLVIALTGMELMAQVQVSAGLNHTCAVTSGNNVRCWGYGALGQLGYSNTNNIGDNELPSTAGDVMVGALVSQVSAGGYHTCALTTGNTVRCWGYNANGRLGYGNTIWIGDNELPSTAGDVMVGLPVSQVSAGWEHTCAVTTGNTVRCWGRGHLGRLGYGNTNDIGDDELPSTAGDVMVGLPVSQVSVGNGYTCVVTTSNTVRCWGAGSLGQLGYGNSNTIGDNEAPSMAGDVDVGLPVTQISSNEAHTCVVTTGNTVRCWGWGNLGRLGYGNTNSIGDDELPGMAGDVMVGLPVSQVSVGHSHTCAVTTGNTVRCWGAGSLGQLGYGNTNSIGDDEAPSTASDVDVGAPVSQVDAGGYGHTCVVTTGGLLRCWGLNQDGQLGCGNTIWIGDDETPAAGFASFCSPIVLPVELTAFNAVVDHNNRVQLTWNTATETNNAGFEIHRLFTRSSQEFFDILGFVNGAGTITEARNYRFETESLELGTHRFRLKQIDFDGQYAYSPEVEVVIEVPGTHVLNAAYPNPFNPQSSVSFIVAREQEVRLTLQDAQGRLVKTLFDGTVPAQTEQWVTIDGSDLSSGVYIYRLTGQNFVESRMVTLQK